MNQQLKDIINKIGNENSKKIFLDFYAANEKKVKAFVLSRIDLERGDNIMQNLTLGFMPDDAKIVIYMKNIMKDPPALKRLMEEFIMEYYDEVVEFARNHPSCPKDAF